MTLFTNGSSLLEVPGRDCPSCKQTEQLLEEVADLSDSLTVETRNFWTEQELVEQHGISRIPAIVLHGQERGAVRFFGIPAGYEFSVLIEDLVAVSAGQTALSEQTKAALASLKEDVHIQVFSTPG